LGEGDYVVIHTQMTSRTKAGKDYDATHVWLFRFEGSLVAEAWEYADTAYAFERMGV
jgi:ketosteroid isomerase-like protein